MRIQQEVTVYIKEGVGSDEGRLNQSQKENLITERVTAPIIEIFF